MPWPGTRPPAAERQTRAAARRSGSGRGPPLPAGPPHSPAPSVRRTGQPRSPDGLPRTGPSRFETTAASVTPSAVPLPGPHVGDGDEPQLTLKPWTPPRCEHPLATLLRSPWGATNTNGRQDARPEQACGEPRIPWLLSARRTPPPRARLGQRRTRGFGRITPSWLLPPGAAPASGRATTPRSDSPGGC
jgi:hypothetical protein